ncbi:hypothetical protein H5410_029889 [Solanum commersonii]|uniref:Chorismate-utilising enzyme C-terminal domain-containing protein n=1 Tax=Solanum commersonii TaxID=4109 RepID=A0A9J5YFC5_SOLCO|nr:hypothetical protein H5410_029889 [Solanum commersonii]
MAFFPLQVSGELLDRLTCWDELRAVLLVGTICGAPKVKAMELIDQLEVGRRGPYSGRFGGISFSGDMDIGLVLRTMVFMNGPRYDTMYSYTDANKCQEWVVHLQFEAQIVADSDPDEKQKECEDRVACLCRVIDLAESNFVKGKSSVLEINGEPGSLTANDVYNYERLRQRRKSAEIKKEKKETNMERNKELLPISHRNVLPFSLISSRSSTYARLHCCSLNSSSLRHEVGRRGPYSGGFGGISFSGDMDIGLALRTMVFMNGARYDTMYSYTLQEWVAHLQSEARIVTDSDPDEKQKECEDKVACLCRAIDLAESTFVKGRS